MGIELSRLLRLLDQRYKGIAHGVGQSEILGRIHVAPIKVAAYDKHFISYYTLVSEMVTWVTGFLTYLLTLFL